MGIGDLICDSSFKVIFRYNNKTDKMSILGDLQLITKANAAGYIQKSFYRVLTKELMMSIASHDSKIQLKRKAPRFDPQYLDHLYGNL